MSVFKHKVPTLCDCPLIESWIPFSLFKHQIWAFQEVNSDPLIIDFKASEELTQINPSFFLLAIKIIHWFGYRAFHRTLMSFGKGKKVLNCGVKENMANYSIFLFLWQIENVNEWLRPPRWLGNNAKPVACLKVAAATQQPWILATLEPDPDLADNQMFVEKAEIHNLMWTLSGFECWC